MALLDANEPPTIQLSLEMTLGSRFILWLSQYKSAGKAFVFTLPIALFGALTYFAPSSDSPKHGAAETPTTTTTQVSATTQSESPAPSMVPRADWVRAETVTVASSVSVTTSSTSTPSSSASRVESTSAEPSSSPTSSVASSTPPSNETTNPVPSSTETTEAAPPSETS